MNPHDFAADMAVLQCLRESSRALLFEQICAATGLSNGTVRIVLQNLEAADAVCKHKAGHRGHPWLYAFAKEPERRGKLSADALVEAWG